MDLNNGKNKKKTITRKETKDFTWFGQEKPMSMVVLIERPPLRRSGPRTLASGVIMYSQGIHQTSHTQHGHAQIK